MLSAAATSINRICDSALAVLYPQVCAICSASVESRHDDVACAACWASSRLFTEGDPLCWKCGTVTEAIISEAKRTSIRCGRCDTDSFTAARACGLYEGALRASVLALKRDPHVGRRLVQAMIRAQRRAPLVDGNLVVPVPLHGKRERERGYNQANVLARELARETGLELDEHALVRRSYTERHRAGMDGRARRESVAGAFDARAVKKIAGRRVLLIDDVFTTGATVSECASVLRAAGAVDVFVLTIARA